MEDETSSSHEDIRELGKADEVDWIEGAGSGGYNMSNDIVVVWLKRRKYRRSFNLTYIPMSCTVQSHAT